MRCAYLCAKSHTSKQQSSALNASQNIEQPLTLNASQLQSTCATQRGALNVSQQSKVQSHKIYAHSSASKCSRHSRAHNSSRAYSKASEVSLQRKVQPHLEKVTPQATTLDQSLSRNSKEVKINGKYYRVRPPYSQNIFT